MFECVRARGLPPAARPSRRPPLLRARAMLSTASSDRLGLRSGTGSRPATSASVCRIRERGTLLPTQYKHTYRGLSCCCTVLLLVVTVLLLQSVVLRKVCSRTLLENVNTGCSLRSFFYSNCLLPATILIVYNCTLLLEKTCGRF